MEYKKLFSREELTLVENWFEKHFDELPEEFELDKSTKYPHFKTTVSYYLDISRSHFLNPTYSGQIFHLYQMQAKLLEMHPEWKEAEEA